MQKIINDVSLNYFFQDNKCDKTIVYLHGWGQNIEMMMPITKPFINKYNILVIDLPGFGKSEEPKQVMSLFDYANLVHELIEFLKLKNVTLIGHSFGGKISICYASKYKVDKLVLLASPFRKSDKKPSGWLLFAKKLKHIPVLNKLEGYLKNKLGSTDYKNASEMMRQIMVKHVNTDVSENAKKIKCPTLIIWGDKDLAVNIKDAYLLETLINDSAVIKFENGTHYAYIEYLNQTNKILTSFIESGD